MSNETCDHFRIHNGQAFFVSHKGGLREIQRTTKHAILEHQAPLPFTVTFENLYYANFLDEMLKEYLETKGLASSLGSLITGRDNNGLHCAALWNPGFHEGILLHQDENNALLCAYLPAITLSSLFHDQELSHKLIALANEMEDVYCELDTSIHSGRWNMKEILAYFSSRLNPTHREP